MLPALGLLVIAACDEQLSLAPVNDVPADQAIVDAATARAAVQGAYDALQDDDNVDYVSGSFTVFGDLSSDDVIHSGTFDTYLEADLNNLLADNGTIEDMWEEIYEGIGRVNGIIEKLPTVPGLTEAEKNDLLGQVYFLRALHYHNLVRFWGGVPLRLTTPANVQEASQIARATEAETYTQILADLAQAETLLSRTKHPTIASKSAARALRSRVLLYRGDWAGVVTAANAVEAAGFALAQDFGDLWQAEGDTPEDIFKVTYTPEEPHFLGWYYRAKGGFGGRYEVAPSCELVNAFDPDVNCAATNPMAGWSPDPADQRAIVSITRNATEAFASKYPTGIGDEDLHMIRFAEVLLNRAEAYARLNNLPAAIADYNRVRVRAGLTADVFGVTDIDPSPTGVNLLDSQQDVLERIWHERRLELAFEGHRFPDLVRTNRAVALLDIADRPHQVRYPIPRQEIDVAPNVTQNPGY